MAAVSTLSNSSSAERLERERLISLMNSMADGVIAVDERCTIALYNAAALNILDSNTMHEGVHLSQVLKPIDVDDNNVDITKLVKATTIPQTDRNLRLQYSDGSIINLYLSIAPVHLGYGEQDTKGFVLLLRDITREKSLEQERDEFISVVSHELRTPIAISEGNISNAEFIVSKTSGLEDVKKALKEAHNQVLFLSDMINDLSTLSRAERGVLKINAEPIETETLIFELQANYLLDATKAGLELKVKTAESLPVLYSSPLYVREILQNLITNAIKYTEHGSVTIAAVALSDGIRFAITDTGIGISKSDQEKVYDKFFRSEDFRTRKSKGTGLGLYVTMKLAKLIQAELSLTSNLNKGSTFSVTIPNL